jgi:hypothetical protein
MKELHDTSGIDQEIKESVESRLGGKITIMKDWGNCMEERINDLNQAVRELQEDTRLVATMGEVKDLKHRIAALEHSQQNLQPVHPFDPDTRAGDAVRNMSDAIPTHIMSNDKPSGLNDLMAAANAGTFSDEKRYTVGELREKFNDWCLNHRVEVVGIGKPSTRGTDYDFFDLLEGQEK